MIHTGPRQRDVPHDRLVDESAQIARAQHDPQAFAPLYHHYVDGVYHYCNRRLGDAEEAADITSLIFSRALAALPHYHGAGSFRSWLFTIAHNAVIDGRHKVRPWVPLEADANRIDPTPDPEELALRADTAREVRTVLAQLPRDQRQVVELRLAGLTNSEMAVILGRSVPAIKMLQGRALIRLRALLDATYGPNTAQTGQQR
jgi:RNA polymerase sigma-70 factor (ECF subfamily)